MPRLPSGQPTVTEEEDLLHDEIQEEKLPAPAEEDVLPSDMELGGAITIDIDDLPTGVVEKEDTAKFWIGTRKDSPIQNVVVGGVCFPSFTGVLRHDSRLEPILPPTRGAVVGLTDREVGRIKESVSLRMVRPRGQGAYVVSRTSSRYKPAIGDRPIAGYLNMVRVGDRMPIDWRDREPPPMYTPRKV